MKHSALSLIAICFSATAFHACGHAPIVSSVSPSESAPLDDAVQAEKDAILAGEWEYEEGGMVVPLRLDRFGNGTYDFKGGHFRTDLLSDHRWAGAWAQHENDREGGFEITLSENFTEGDGRWWYTRIEGDAAPKKSGGRFHVLKVHSAVHNQSLLNDRSPQ
jgi:hypothetical protein